MYSDAQLNLEKIIVGTGIFNPKLIGDVYLANGLTAEMFTDYKTRTLYTVLCDMFYKNLEPNLVSVCAYLESIKMISAIGAEFIATLENDNHAANIDFYVNNFTVAFQRRKAKQIISEMLSTFDDTTRNPAELIAQLSEKLGNLVDVSKKTSVLNMPELWTLLFNHVKETQKKIEEGKKSTGILSGFVSLDEATDGFQNGELTIIGARPSIGKTSFALSCCMNIAKDTPCAFISLETPDRQIAIKTASLIKDIPTRQIKTAFLSETQKDSLFGSGADEIKNRKFYLIDRPRLHISELKNIVRTLVLSKGVKIIFLDYIGLVDAGDVAMPVFEKQSIVSRQLKSYAREFNIPVVALCQVNRNAEKDNKAPSLADLRGSGSIEQDADVVMFLHGERFIEKDEQTIDRDLIIAKNRNGQCGRQKIVFRKNLQRYENAPETISKTSKSTSKTTSKKTQEFAPSDWAENNYSNDSGAVPFDIF